nr:MAG TPA: hypothetical protein [Caudoviricetes sp.]
MSIEYSNFGGEKVSFPENLARLQAERGETNYRLVVNRIL